MRVALSLGSNKGDRQKFLFCAIHELLAQKIVLDIKCSTLFENKALLSEGAPSDWNCDFINCAVIGNTNLVLRELFYSIKDIEKFLGRKEGRRWSPREIDIDILLYGDIQVQNCEYKVPHVSMLKRDFVLLPLKEIAPQWVYTGGGKYHNMTIENIVKEKYEV